MQLKQISLSKLLMSEVHFMVDDVIRIMQRHDAHKLQIEETYKMVVGLQHQVQTLTKLYGPCFITQQQSEIHTKRLEHAGYIFTQVLSIGRIIDENFKSEAYLAKLTVRLYLFEIRKKNRPTVNMLLIGFLNSIDKDERVKNAFDVLGLLSFVEELRKLNFRFHELDLLKTRSNGKKQKFYENKRIQKNGQDILRIFFAHVQLTQMTYPDLNEEYVRLYSELNRLIPKYTKAIKTRATFNKKRAAAKAKATAYVEPKQHILSVNGKETGVVTIGGLKKVEKKKVVSKKGKQVRKIKKKPIVAFAKKGIADINNTTTLRQVPQQNKDPNG